MALLGQGKAAKMYTTEKLLKNAPTRRQGTLRIIQGLNLCDKDHIIYSI